MRRAHEGDYETKPGELSLHKLGIAEVLIREGTQISPYFSIHLEKLDIFQQD